eukprot:CAMPEP_0178916338 /NCGR_PEP_ID=MMETSP0786-20121207/12570_1 /TAXON_ID=186022 /ORGANISM="Thalassionema frauenfeldii, Strain CCMP 1798" /LENGTH=560 /DNA_ID=CAMNT_0020589635 /DNA_START=201 /DNA_END=1882 /DNA_ORIENTATION=-
MKQTEESSASTSSTNNNNTTTMTTTLWIIRMYYLCCYGAMGSIEPYLTLHYHSALKLSGPMIGVLDSVFSMTTFVATPLWGLFLTTMTKRQQRRRGVGVENNNNKQQNNNNNNNNNNNYFGIIYIISCNNNNNNNNNNNYFGIIYINFMLSLWGFRFLLRYDNHDDDDDATTTTTTSLILCICLLAMALAPNKPLMDSMVVSHCAPSSSSFGRLRLFGTIGFGLGTSLVGLLRKNNNNNNNYSSSSSSFGDDTTTTITTAIVGNHPVGAILSNRLFSFVSNIQDHHLPFVVHFALSIPAFFSIVAFHRMHLLQNHHNNNNNNNTLKEKETTETSKSSSSSSSTARPSQSNHATTTTTTTTTTLQQVFLRNWTFFVLAFQLGATNGVTEAFCSLGMTEAGLSTKTIGLFRLLSIATSIPMYSSNNNKKNADDDDDDDEEGKEEEESNTVLFFVLILVIMAIRILSYGLMPLHPLWLGALAEGLRGVVVGLYRSTSTVHIHQMAPPELCASVSLLAGAVYQGLGRSIGSLVGGYLQNTLGTSQTFLWLGSFDIIFAAVFMMM